MNSNKKDSNTAHQNTVRIKLNRRKFINHTDKEFKKILEIYNYPQNSDNKLS